MIISFRMYFYRMCSEDGNVLSMANNGFENPLYAECEKTEKGTIRLKSNMIQFVNSGTGIGQFMNGTVNMKMQCSVGNVHMPESVALFSMTI